MLEREAVVYRIVVIFVLEREAVVYRVVVICVRERSCGIQGGYDLC